jgi:hypothetical protein
MKPVSVESIGGGDQIHRPHAHRLLLVEIVAKNALQHPNACHLMSGGPCRFGIMDETGDCRGLPIYCDQIGSEGKSLGVIEMGHTSVDVGSHRPSVSDRTIEPVILQFIPDSRQRRRDAPLVSEKGVGSGEEISSINGNSTEIATGVARDAAECAHRQVHSLLRIRWLWIIAKEGQRGLQVLSLARCELVPWMLNLRQRSGEFSQFCCISSGTIFMALCAAELFIEVLPSVRIDTLDIPDLSGRQ